MKIRSSDNIHHHHHQIIIKFCFICETRSFFFLLTKLLLLLTVFLFIKNIGTDACRIHIMSLLKKKVDKDLTKYIREKHKQSREKTICNPSIFVSFLM